MIEVVKGGLILDLGVRGFLPASLVDIRRVQDLDEFLGQELRCKVIELNRSRNNVVLSRRAVLEDERKEMRQAILDRLNPGDVVEGQISNIVDFGAFVDLDGMDGLIHISELSWSHVNHPSEVLEIGQTVKVKVLDIDRERQRISLGLKQTQTRSVAAGARQLPARTTSSRARVTKVVTFGAFVEILPGVEGLVHISELAQHHVENPREVVSQGDAVNVLILEIDAERRRLSLSLKRVEEGDDAGPARRRRRVRALDARPRGSPRRSFPTSGCGRGRGAAEAEPSRASRRGRGRAGGRGCGRDRAGGRDEPRSRRPRPRPTAEAESPRAEADAAEAESSSAEAESRAEAERRAEPADEAERLEAARRAEPEPPERAAVTRPLAVAITGGIGAGKSEALDAFARARRGDGLERRDRPPAARDGPRGAATRSSSASATEILGEDGASTAAQIAEVVFARPRGAGLARGAAPPAASRAST